MGWHREGDHRAGDYRGGGTWPVLASWSILLGSESWAVREGGACGQGREGVGAAAGPELGTSMGPSDYPVLYRTASNCAWSRLTPFYDATVLTKATPF